MKVPPLLQKLVIWVVIAFIAYAVFVAPEKAANFVLECKDAIGHGAASLKELFDGILT